MVYGTENVFFWYKDAVKDKFAGIGAAHAELVEFARAGEPIGCGGNDESCDAFRAFLGFRFGIDNYRVCVWTLFLGDWVSAFERFIQKGQAELVHL